MEKRSRVVRQSGKANSQGWVKLGQEAHSICPKMGKSLLVPPPSHGTVLEGLQMELQSFKEEKGHRAAKTAGLHQKCYTKPTHTCVPQKPLWSLADAGGTSVVPLDVAFCGKLHIP